jgi:NTP pyrophosphatase (non-canonical NTP hydrolase)
MARLGGYWRPLAAIARLLEELGELAESLASPMQDRDELASELADLWIITTAVADQFLGEVAEPGAQQASAQRGQARDAGARSAPGEQLGELVTAAGQIARIVNYYDGPKTPRSLAGWPSLSDATAEFHRTLAGLASAHEVDLGVAVADKLSAIAVRDSERFTQAEHDPGTAPSLARFHQLRRTPWSAQIEQARLWGGPAWCAQPLASNVAAIVPTLIRFTRAAIPERLDGYLVTGPELESGELLDEWARAVLRGLAAHDPRPAQPARDPAEDPLAEDTLTFNGMRLSVTILPEPGPQILLRPGDVERADEPAAPRPAPAEPSR